jgi:hypothetical protein
MYRAINDQNTGSAMTFSYQGQDTLIKPRLLIPISTAISTVAAFIVHGTLADSVEWITGPFPPRPMAEETGTRTYIDNRSIPEDERK